MRGTIPLSLLPGRKESGEVGRPKKYLSGPDLVMSQDTASVPIVDRIRTIGKDPKHQGIKRVLSMYRVDWIYLKWESMKKRLQ